MNDTLNTSGLVGLMVFVLMDIYYRYKIKRMVKGE